MLSDYETNYLMLFMEIIAAFF